MLNNLIHQSWLGVSVQSVYYFTNKFHLFRADFGKQIFAPFARRIARQCAIHVPGAAWPEAEELEAPWGAWTSSAGEWEAHSWRGWGTAPEPILIFPLYPLQFRFSVFVWIIEPEREWVCVWPRISFPFAFSWTRPGAKSIYFPHLSGKCSSAI